MGMYTPSFRVDGLTVNHRAKATTRTEPIEVEHSEKRKGSIFAENSRRKESVSGMTSNVTGERVICSP
jgi:hypothetical protein